MLTTRPTDKPTKKYAHASHVFFFDIDDTLFLNHPDIVFTGCSVRRWRVFFTALKEQYPDAIIGIITAKERDDRFLKKPTIYNGLPSMLEPEIYQCYDPIGRRLFGYDYSQYDPNQSLIDFITPDFVYYTDLGQLGPKSAAMDHAYQHYLGDHFDKKKMYLIDNCPLVKRDMEQNGKDYSFILVPQNVYSHQVNQDGSWAFHLLEEAGIQFMLHMLDVMGVKPSENVLSEISKRSFVDPPVTMTSRLGLFLTPKAPTTLPPVHVLMPAYNVSSYISASIESVLKQDYQNLKLIIYDDGSTDGTENIITSILNNNSLLREKIIYQRNNINLGVFVARKELFKKSREINQDAYILSLDSDNRFIRIDVATTVIQQMLKTKADICLFNFAIEYENENQKNFFSVVAHEMKRSEHTLSCIQSMPHGATTPSDMTHTLEFHSGNFAKCYAPTIKRIPIPSDCPFEDFVYMSMMLQANVITALPPNYLAFSNLHRATSISGHVTHKKITHDIPEQLKVFFKAVLQDSEGEPNQLQKIFMAREFFVRKRDLYIVILRHVLSNTVPGSDIDINTVGGFTSAMATLHQEIDNALNQHRKQVEPILVHRFWSHSPIM